MLGDGSFIFNGDGQNSLQRVRKALPSDPVIDRARYDSGQNLYRADAPGRPALQTTNGAVGVNYLAQLKTPGELAVMSKPARKAYMLDTFKVTDWTDQNHDDVAYYLDWNCVQGVERLRNPPVMVNFDQAVAQVKQGTAMKRNESTTVLTGADVLAVDWIKA